MRAAIPDAVFPLRLRISSRNLLRRPPPVLIALVTVAGACRCASVHVSRALTEHRSSAFVHGHHIPLPAHSVPAPRRTDASQSPPERCWRSHGRERWPTPARLTNERASHIPVVLSLGPSV
ncbi:hypothetical protein TRVL_03522 [Trypanosoma vivax]|nr:hypothetical protein TRVL_03522 [Trypanosoma vivax]